MGASAMLAGRAALRENCDEDTASAGEEVWVIKLVVVIRGGGRDVELADGSADAH
jgi:hypothetical protein